MKKLIFIVFLLMSLNLMAEMVVKSPMEDFYPSAERDHLFEIKSPKFERVVLDCSSFITGISFYNENKLKYNIYIDPYDCEQVQNTFQEAKDNNEKLCLEVEEESNTLMVSPYSSDCR